MRLAFLRPSLEVVVALTCAGILNACGGGGQSVTGAVVPVATQSVPIEAQSGPVATRSVRVAAASVPLPPRSAHAVARSVHVKHALGFKPTAAAKIAQFERIRRTLSTTTLPTSVDLSPAMPSVGDQGGEGSCVSWATAYAMRGYEARRDVWSAIAPASTNPANNFSAAFVYNQVNGGQDDGSTIPDSLNLLQTTGAATLADMPYVDGQYTLRPSPAAVADAAHYRLSSWGYIVPTDFASMQSQLAAGLPVVIAINVYDNFFDLGPNAIYTAISGPYAGGHAITVVGYDNTKQAFKFINSWGTSWGSAGYGWISYGALAQIVLEAYSAIDDQGPPTSLPGVTPAPIATPTPTLPPTASPTTAPTILPTTAPTIHPTTAPTIHPTAQPSAKPTAAPSAKPTAAPSAKPTTKPSAKPTAKPSAKPTPKPSAKPTPKPSAKPTAKPSAKPTPTP